MAHNADEHRFVKVGLDQVVLRARLDGLQPQRLVAGVGQDHGGDVRRGGAHLAQGVQTLAIGQRQGQQNQIRGGAPQLAQGGAELVSVSYLELFGARFPQQRFDQSDRNGIVFNQEQSIQVSRPSNSFAGRCRWIERSLSSLKVMRRCSSTP